VAGMRGEMGSDYPAYAPFFILNIHPNKCFSDISNI
jgi:hypothetical protein